MAAVSNNKSWENIFDKYRILPTIKKNGFADITADQIKAVDGKEARLMTKVDFRENLPLIMSAEGLSILAIKNGLYRIANNDPFIDISNKITTKIVELSPPKNIISIDPYNIKSESAALDIAVISKMSDIVFGEEGKLSIRGRLRGNLSFKIGTVPYNIDGVQIEVDGGYETKKAIHLIEAKIGYRNNINIRQLLYPQLYWKAEVGGKKDIKSYVFYLQDDIYRFIPYYYDSVIGYADHAEEKAFRFKPLTIPTKFSLYGITVNEENINSNVPFPQADKFDTINTMLIVLNDYTCANKEILKTHFDIVDRQIDYYYNVLKFFKLCIEENDCLILTEKGKNIIDLPFRERMIELAKIVFSEPIINAVLNRRTPNKSLYTKYKMNSENTIIRRLQTVKAWISYFKRILDE
jgi:hypothetical protein